MGLICLLFVLLAATFCSQAQGPINPVLGVPYQPKPRGEVTYGIPAVPAAIVDSIQAITPEKAVKVKERWMNALTRAAVSIWARPHPSLLPQEKESLSAVPGFSEVPRATADSRHTKPTANDSPSPRGRGPG